MRLKMKNVFASLVIGFLLVFTVVSGAQAYTDVLAFGDSLSDNGAADGYGNGVYSNGQVWVEYLADDLGVSLKDMAYGGAVSGQNNPYAYGSVYKATYNAYIAASAPEAYAAAQATAAADASGYDVATGLQWQVDQYVTTQMALRTTELSKSLITMTAGGNDFFNYLANAAGTPYSPKSALASFDPVSTVNNIAAAVAKLIAEGGKNFLIQNLAMDNAWADGFNSYLAAVLAGLSSDDVVITLLDMNLLVADVDNETGTFLEDFDPSDPETFAWWDQVGVHPTTEVHRQIANYAGASLPVPEPATALLLIVGLLGITGIQRRKV